MKRNDPFISAAAFLLTALLLVAASALVSLIGTIKGEQDDVLTMAPIKKTVVIDAGHGGMDGGAVAQDGTLEKDINLSIAGIVKTLFEVSGYKTVLTREKDEMLDTQESKGSAKMRDLKRRLEISSSYPDAITVSIHCNKFPQSECKGMQVYYSDSDLAKSTASAVQSTFLELDPSNHRQIKAADSSVYLLHRAKSPTILVECGFLSNEEELEKLKNENSQKKLALVMLSGIDAAYIGA